MNDKIPTKITGFFITVIGTGIVLRTITTIIDRILFSNREFKISEFQNFGIIIFLNFNHHGYILVASRKKTFIKLPYCDFDYGIFL